jgi:prepilin-type N-terminal cleavage/methylation domain-containing protein/prepilin-type processing-associated H-X9-DG protein
MITNRLGFTLIETLVVIVIIGLLVAVILPAVQSARETARRATCQNNIRQIAVAIASYESHHRRLPSLYNGSFLPQPRNALDEFHFHSWRSAILGELEQSAILETLDMSVSATDAPNQVAINGEIPVLICPSTSNTHPIVPEVQSFTQPATAIGTAARSDYEAIAGVCVSVASSSIDMGSIRFGPWGEPSYNMTTGQSRSYRKARLADISDGLSHTLLVGERGGRPDIFDRGNSEIPFPYVGEPAAPDWHQAAWGISTNIWWLVIRHEHSVNQTNRTGIFGFHPGGANVTFADGSARFLSDSTSPSVLAGMATRAEGEPVESE